MRILWLCNIVLPELCSVFGFKKVQAGGWLSGMWEQLKKCDGLELAVCVPIRDKSRMMDGTYLEYRYYSFQEISGEEEILEGQRRFTEIIRDFKPDRIHIWGTEYLHSYAMVQACMEQNLREKIIVNIQGLVSVYALHYRFGLSDDLVKAEQEGNSIEHEIQEFIWRGQYEKTLLKKVSYVVGRTDWDRACCLQINPAVKYFHCGEILREVFYKNSLRWSTYTCEKYSIFISQASYPVKGFHLVLEALVKLAEQYRSLRVYVSGTNLENSDTAYGIYIRKKIKEYHLEKMVSFVGKLSQEEMYQYYLKANVFLSASVIENSSNSVCEAMCVGTPVVASYVGGIPTIITHGISGFLYPLDAGYMMEYYISQIFDDNMLAQRLSEKEQERAAEYNSRETALEKMLKIYQNTDGGSKMFEVR